jgi:dihydropteroate synthase
MTTYLRAFPETFQGARRSSFCGLGGSAHVHFEMIDQMTRGARPQELPVSDLTDDARGRLTAPRADLCGLSLDHPRIMGILNVTPDSFSDGGTLATVQEAVARAKAMAVDADILDIGGESTRPGAAEVSIAEEITRTAPVIRAIRDAGIVTPISIDTRKAAVAEAALAAGADMVNDVSAFRFDPDLADVVARAGVPVCLMHSVGTPETMQDHARYDDVVFDVFDHLRERVAVATKAGISRDRIIVDPGIGFGKTLQHNVTVLRGLAVYHDLGLPILLGASRKRFIGTISGEDDPAKRVFGSIAVALHAVAQGVQILRVHDTKETRQALSLHLAMSGAAAP